MSAKAEAPNVQAITSFVRGLPGGGRAFVTAGDILAADAPVVRAHPQAFVVIGATSAEVAAAKAELQRAREAATPPFAPKPYTPKPGLAVRWSGGPRRTAENDAAGGELPRFPWTRKPAK